MVGNTVDPLGGSYYLETLTSQIGNGAFTCFEHIEAMGGAVEATENGYYLRVMADGMYKYQQEVESGRKTIIGVNKFRLEEEPEIKTFHGAPEAEGRQISHLRDIRSRRDSIAVRNCLSRIREVAQGKISGKDIELVPVIIDAVKVYTSIGEIFGVLRETFGEFQPETMF
jgi:methylmalonyl-CoA mutase N-terminal domain/subunit